MSKFYGFTDTLDGNIGIKIATVEQVEDGLLIIGFYYPRTQTYRKEIYKRVTPDR